MKNKALRSALAVILVIALVLTMTACKNGGEAESTPIPTPATVKPATEAPQTEAPTVAPETQAPEVLGDTTEADLAKYGITFPDGDLIDGKELVYGEDLQFGIKLDEFNEYQEENGFTFNYDYKITAVDHNGKAMTSSTAKEIGTSSDHKFSTVVGGAGGSVMSLYGGFPKPVAPVDYAKAGIYTIEYTIEVKLEDKTYGYYTPEEVEEEYTFTKTYEIAKAELELETKDDAYQVADDIFFVNADIENADNAVLEDYKFSVNITSCDGTVCGEYPLAISITDEDENAITAEEINLDNYFVTVKEGTRYILNAEEVARANAMRQMASIDGQNQYTTEYSAETIAYYNELNAGEKVMVATADVTAQDDYIVGEDYYLISDRAVTPEEVEEAIFNMERAEIGKEMEEAIKAYMTASTSRKQDIALENLADLILATDNTQQKYGSDLAFILGDLATGIIVPHSNSMDSVYFTSDGSTALLEGYKEFGLAYLEVDTAAGHGYIAVDDFDMTPGHIYAIDKNGADDSLYSFLTFRIVGDEKDGYKVDFDCELASNIASKYLVNSVYDEFMNEYLIDLSGAERALVDVTTTQEVTQENIDTLVKAVEDMKEEYENLLDFQRDMGLFDDITFAKYHEVFLGETSKIINRWNAYITLIDSYGFNSSYIDNAKQDEMSATYAAVYGVLGYDFANSNGLKSVIVDKNAGVSGGIGGGVMASKKTEYYKKALSNQLFAVDTHYATPTLFVDGMIEAAGDMVETLIAVQAEVDSYKTDLVQYVVNTGYYAEVFDKNSVAIAFPTVDFKDPLNVDGIASIKANIATVANAGVDTAKDLNNDLYNYIDACVANEMLNTDNSGFKKDLAKEGFDVAMAEMMEGIAGKVEDKIDDLAVEKVFGTPVATVNIVETENTVRNLDISVKVDGVALVLDTDYTISIKGTAKGNAYTGTNAFDFIGNVGGDNTLDTAESYSVEVTFTFIGDYAGLASVTADDSFSAM